MEGPPPTELCRSGLHTATLEPPMDLMPATSHPTPVNLGSLYSSYPGLESHPSHLNMLRYFEDVQAALTSANDRAPEDVPEQEDSNDGFVPLQELATKQHGMAQPSLGLLGSEPLTINEGDLLSIQNSTVNTPVNLGLLTTPETTPLHLGVAQPPSSLSTP
eukprot:CAMPEP_0171122466 /NCGR_PEP_ID=MMETSP0766_2-20121228/105070_1 /TAXON_ID=439317 /ORGANISM="Gambierdiscus australes, Strain CAWD 149" /LENGTH=160 /DNA_ID=CAMNT_0011585307 /DNA_START=36 /DNA_END=515 /DNA_ORIENTATION=-